MNTFFVVAAGLCLLGGILHSILGERLILTKLSPANLPSTVGSGDFVLRVLRLFWHVVSVAWWGFAGLLWILAFLPATVGTANMARVIAVTFVVSAAVAFVVSKGKHFSWGVLLVISIVAWLGTQKPARTATPTLPGPLAAGWKGASVCELLRENQRQRALRCTFPPGVGHERHYHPPHVGYALTGSTMRITDAKGTREQHVPAGTHWVSDGVAWHEVLNVGDTTGVYLLVEPLAGSCPR